MDIKVKTPAARHHNYFFAESDNFVALTVLTFVEVLQIQQQQVYVSPYDNTTFRPPNFVLTDQLFRRSTRRIPCTLWWKALNASLLLVHSSFIPQGELNSMYHPNGFTILLAKQTQCVHSQQKSQMLEQL